MKTFSKTPKTVNELMYKANSLAGLSLGELAEKSKDTVPANLLKKKAWIGNLLEIHLGADAKNQALPDFSQLEIELKTLPINQYGKPLESTYICRAPDKAEARFNDSALYKKTKSILFIPILSNKELPIAQRVIAQPLLWNRTEEYEQSLYADWYELSENLRLGKFDKISAKSGKLIQLRPKAANSKSFIKRLDEDLNISYIVPKGFYFRTNFTTELLKKHYLIDTSKL